MLGIWGTSQMSGYLGNFPTAWVFGKFPKYPVIWEISKILQIYHPQIPIGIWGILQIPGYLGNFNKIFEENRSRG